MAQHMVRIGRLDTRLRTVGARAATEPQLAAALSHRLSDLLATLLEPVLDAYDGVIRINTLDLQLNGTGFGDPTRLAHLLAEAIACEVGQALTGHHRPIMVWPSRTAYLAHYLRHRLGILPGSAWCFEDLRALNELTAGQVLIQLVTDEPQILWELAQDDPHASVLARLDPQQCRELLARMLHGPKLSPILPQLSAAQLTAPVSEHSAQALARHTLQLFWGALAHDPGPARPNPLALLPAMMAVVALAVLLEQDPRGTVTALKHPAELLTSQLHQHGSLPAAYLTALDQAVAHPQLRELLQRQVHLNTSAPKTTPNEPATGRERTGNSAVAPIHSRWAGCSLLLPVLCLHGFDRHLNPEQLHQLVLATLDLAERSPAAADRLLYQLFQPTAPKTADTREAGERTEQHQWPQIPAALAKRVHPESRALAAADPAHPWSGLLLALFASRLPGLQRSSAGYLRRQFLSVPGSLEISATQLRVHLVGPDLAVVLSMAGLSGPQQALPWLGGRSLVLHLGGLHP